MLFGVISKMVKSRAVRSAKARFARSGIFRTWEELSFTYDVNNLEQQYQSDLEKCYQKNPSVIKREDYHMYHSSGHRVYVYYIWTGVRDIRPRRN